MGNRGQLAAINEPWGFPGVRRETRNVTADSRIFYVDPNNTLANDSNSGEDAEYPLATIAQAVTNCRAYQGDTIYVLSNDGWQYGTAGDTPITESVTIPYTKPGIKLIGVGAGPLGVYWTPAAALGTCLTVEALDVTVQGFSFTGNTNAGNGIYAEWDGVTKFGENLIVRNCVFDDAIDNAIQLEYSWFNIIEGCYFEECDVYGIYAAAAASGTAYNIIRHNYFIDIATGAITLNDGDENNIYSNTLYNTDAQNGAAATNEGINLTNGQHNSVHHNTFSCLLPVPANGDYDDFNTGAATDAWVSNYCMDGPTVTNPT